LKQHNVAVWGLGPHAIKNILPALEVCPGINLYGVCSRNADVVSKHAAEQGCLGWSDPEEMFEDSKVDTIYVSTPIGLHASHGKSVLVAKKHLWCEKPLAATQAQVLTLVGLSRELGLTLAEGYMYLYHPQFLYLKELLDSEALGDLRNVTCRFGIPPLERPGFRNDPELGGGAFLDVGSYLISAVTALFPESTPEILFTKIDTAPGSRVDSGGRAILRYLSGVYVTLEWGINCAYRNEIDLWGSTGSVFSERFFSKPADYVPRFRFLDLRGRESYTTCRSGNHFVSMFEEFRMRADDPVEAEKERAAIGQRASLMNEVVKAQI